MDLQEDSELFWKCTRAGRNKVVLPCKERDENIIKKAFAKLYYILIHKFVEKRMPVGGCDCYLLTSDDWCLSVWMRRIRRDTWVLWAGFKTDEIYFHRRDREIGKSRWTLARRLLVLDSMMSFHISRFALCQGSVSHMQCAVVMIYVLIEKFTVGTPILGWASLMCVVLFSFGVLMLMMEFG